jgi:crotonobetainyl-CoA:carnitine CoA-transferase CaiB-like acyl-CoA transferase
MSARGGLLKGLRVLDFTRLLPGPAATHMLGQMGASIYKIEAPQRRDSVRTTHPGMYLSKSAFYHVICTAHTKPTPSPSHDTRPLHGSESQQNVRGD